MPPAITATRIRLRRSTARHHYNHDRCVVVTSLAVLRSKITTITMYPSDIASRTMFFQNTTWHISLICGFGSNHSFRVAETSFRWRRSLLVSDLVCISSCNCCSLSLLILPSFILRPHVTAVNCLLFRRVHNRRVRCDVGKLPYVVYRRRTKL